MVFFDGLKNEMINYHARVRQSLISNVRNFYLMQADSEPDNNKMEQDNELLVLNRTALNLLYLYLFQLFYSFFKSIIGKEVIVELKNHLR